MAGFLRKKFGNDANTGTSQKPSRSSVASASTSSTSVPPLFAKFSSTSQTTPERNVPRVVSSPMQLSGAARRESALPSNNRRTAAVETRTTTARRRDDREIDARLRKGHPQQAIAAGPVLDSFPSDTTAHNTAEAQDASSQLQFSAVPSSRPSSRAFFLDKPLPPPVPTTHLSTDDPLETSPPSLPPNERASVVTPTTQPRRHGRLSISSKITNKPLPQLTRSLAPSSKPHELPNSSSTELSHVDREVNTTSTKIPSRSMPKAIKPQEIPVSRPTNGKIRPSPSPHDIPNIIPPVHDVSLHPLTSNSISNSPPPQDSLNHQSTAIDSVDTGPAIPSSPAKRKVSAVRDEPVVASKPSAYVEKPPQASYGSLLDHLPAKLEVSIPVMDSPMFPSGVRSLTATDESPPLPSNSSPPKVQRTPSKSNIRSDVSRSPSHTKIPIAAEQPPRFVPDQGPQLPSQASPSKMDAITITPRSEGRHSAPLKDIQPSPSSSVSGLRPLPTVPAETTMPTSQNDIGPRAQEVTPKRPRKSASLRSNNSQIGLAKGKPLIFTAMATVEQEAEERATQPQTLSPRQLRDGNTSPPSSSSHSHASTPLEYGSSPSHPSHPNSSTLHNSNDIVSFGGSLSTSAENMKVTPPPSSRVSRPGTADHSPQLTHRVTRTMASLSPNTTSMTTPPHSPSVSGSALSPRQSFERPQTPQTKKSGKHGISISINSHPNGSPANTPSAGHSPNTVGSYRTLTKVRPTTPASPVVTPQKMSRSADVDYDIIRNTGLPLDDDPFAKVEGVKMLKPNPKDGTSPTKDGTGKKSRTRHSKGNLGKTASALDGSSEDTKSATPNELNGIHSDTNGTTNGTGWRQLEKSSPIVTNTKTEQDRPMITLVMLLSNPLFLSSLLGYLAFWDWCILSSVSKEIRSLLTDNSELREEVLERYLKTVGYARWTWKVADPLPLSLKDLNDYMRGVSIPTHEYARFADSFLQSRATRNQGQNGDLSRTLRDLAASTRAYTRVVLRLRAQAEKELEASSAQSTRSPSAKTNAYGTRPPSRSGATRVSSRAPSPAPSSYSHSPYSQSPMSSYPALSRPTTPGSNFHSPLFRLRRAPLLRVFVPSPDGDWLSDASVLACEAELKRAGVLGLLRMGDVVWDVAVGDEGNVGRLVWDSSFLIDLDYTYSPVGDLPKYMHALAFPPSYFHKVIRTSPVATNPIARIDISPWGEEIATNLQLLQDRVRTETPQGAYHNVVRWVHRSSFAIRPPDQNLTRPHTQTHHRFRSQSLRIPIPNSNGLFVDQGWYGTIVVETEGTNESLADLQDRCGPGAFPPRAGRQPRDKESKNVFRILRERSRPGEIWIRTVSATERLL